MSSIDRSRCSPTRMSGPTPIERRRCASWLARRFRASYDSVRTKERDGRRIRRFGDAPFESFVQTERLDPRRPWHRQQLGPFFVAQHRDIRDRAIRLPHEAFEQSTDVRQHPGGRRVVQRPTRVLQSQYELCVGPAHQRHRIAGMALAGKAAIEPRPAVPTQRRIKPMAFKDHQRFKQFGAGWYVAPGVDARQRRVFVRPTRELLRPKIGEPRHDRLLRHDGHSERQRVDVGADDVVGAVECRTAAGPGDTEQNVVLTSVSAEKKGPRASHERADCAIGLACERMQTPCFVGGQS